MRRPLLPHPPPLALPVSLGGGMRPAVWRHTTTARSALARTPLTRRMLPLRPATMLGALAGRGITVVPSARGKVPTERARVRRAVVLRFRDAGHKRGWLPTNGARWPALRKIVPPPRRQSPLDSIGPSAWGHSGRPGGWASVAVGGAAMPPRQRSPRRKLRSRATGPVLLSTSSTVPTTHTGASISPAPSTGCGAGSGQGECTETAT